jgi:hypothetical protein
MVRLCNHLEFRLKHWEQIFAGTCSEELNELIPLAIHESCVHCVHHFLWIGPRQYATQSTETEECPETCVAPIGENWWGWSLSLAATLVVVAQGKNTIFFNLLGWVETESIWYVGHAVSERGIDMGNLSTRRKPSSLPLYLPQIPHDLAWDRTWAAAVGGWRLTVWSAAWPKNWTDSHAEYTVLLSEKVPLQKKSGECWLMC